MEVESQRYGRDKTTLVNKTYICQGSYRRKFDGATGNPNVNRTLYHCSKAALLHRSGTILEDMYWIDGDSGKVVLSVTDSTEPRAIVYTEKMKRMICNMQNLVTLHTHPSSMPPSIDDFNSCFRNHYREGFIACHDGKVFRYSSQQEISRKLYELYLAEYKEAGMSSYDAQLATITKLRENHAIDFEEVLPYA